MKIIITTTKGLQTFENIDEIVETKDGLELHSGFDAFYLNREQTLLIQIIP